MAGPLVFDALWAEIAPLLPPSRPRPKGPWEMLPKEMGCGSGMTCWRLRDWQGAGIWARLHRVLLDRLGRANAIDGSRGAVDSAAVAAKRGAKRPARTRPIAAGRVPSAIFWSMPTASRSPFA